MKKNQPETMNSHLEIKITIAEQLNLSEYRTIITLYFIHVLSIN